MAAPATDKREVKPLGRTRPRLAWSLSELLPSLPLISIVDIGAMLPDQQTEPYAALVRAGKARVIGFEPNQAECDRLNGIFGPPNRFYPHFVGDGAEAVYYETTRTYTGSLFRPNRRLLETFQNLYGLTTVVAEHPVTTRRLDDMEELGDVDFVKIDVQGSELAVFQGGTKALAGATIVQTEVEFVELYEGQPLFADIDRFLRGAGFQFHTLLTFGGRCFKPMLIDNDPNRGLRQLLWADALYVRDFLHLEAVPIDKLLRLAVILHDLYESYDFCMHILGVVDTRQNSVLQAQYLSRLKARAP